MIKQISLLSLISLLFFASFIVESVQALDCEAIPAEESIAHANIILQAKLTDAVYADGTKYGAAGFRADPVYMRAEVSRVWRGRANATEVIVFADPEWGGVPRIEQDYIFYLSRRDTILSTGNCVRLSTVNTEEIQLIEAIVGTAVAPVRGETFDLAIYFPSETVANNALQPIAIGPGAELAESVTSAGTLPFNLLCLLLLLVTAAGGRLMTNRDSTQKATNSDPVK